MTYRELLETLDAWFARGRAAAGSGVIPCRRECSACCHGVFDISAADAGLVAEGVAALSTAERTALQSRARQQLEQYAARLPDGRAPWDVDALSEQSFDALTEALAGAPCPALDADGGCAIYAHRPATCRMTGLAMDAGSAGRLDNECPIQADHPEYAALPPTAFDLMGFEDQAACHDRDAMIRGCVTTTVAAAAVTSEPRRA